MAAASVEEDRMALAQARLALEEKEALEAIKGDLCQWLSKPDVMALDISATSFLDTLDSGEELCRLATLIQEGAKSCQASGKKLSALVPMNPLSYRTIKATRGSAMFQASARDNTAQFIGWCRKLGVEEAVIFESVGLVEHRDEKRVILCLLDVARFAEKVGITPPQLVRLEREIDLLEAQSGSSDEEMAVLEEVVAQEREERAGGVEERVGEVEERVGGVEQETETEMQEAERKEEEKEENEEESNEAEQEEEEEEEEEGPTPAKRQKQDGPETAPNSQPKRLERDRPTHKEKPQRKPSRPLTPKKEETVDEKVMHSLQQCTCQHSILVKGCGKGKFIVRPNPQLQRKITLYARMLSDRVMVRVGGGWDTLEHFLLKHDPCRLHNLSAIKPQASDSVKAGPSLGKRRRED